jgi:hypothetical protein
MPKVRKAPDLLNCETLKVTTPRWIWYPYIPANCATMLFGVGGIGKSYMACDLAAALSAGRALPGQSSKEIVQHKVLLLSAEDSPSSVIKPRLIKCGANLKNVFIPAEAFTLDTWGLDVVKKYMEKCKATIVIIDPIVHYMGGKIDMNKMNEVRAITGALHQSAMNTDSAIIIIHHARKGSEGQTYEQAAGSADFVNAVRSVLYAHKTNDGTSVMEHVKTNYAVYGKALAFYIDEDGYHWVGEYDENMLKTSGATKLLAAKSFLSEILRDGPVASKEVVKQAKADGMTMTTINRAKGGVAESIMRYVDENRIWLWRLKGDKREPSGMTKGPRKGEQSDVAYAEAFLKARGQWNDSGPDTTSKA